MLTQLLAHLGQRDGLCASAAAQHVGELLQMTRVDRIVRGDIYGEQAILFGSPPLQQQRGGGNAQRHSELSHHVLQLLCVR